MRFSIFDTTEGGSEGRAHYRGAGRVKACMLPPIVVALIVAMAPDAVAQTKIDLRTQTRSVDFSGAASTKPSRAGTVLPATCSEGETFLKTNAAAGQNFYVCTTGSVWSLQGAVIPSVTGYANMLLATDGAALIWKALGGDVSGAPGSLTVSKLQGRTISAATPAGGQVLAWNPAAVQWEPQSVGFGQIAGSVTDGQVGAGINAAKIGGGAVSNTVFGYLSNVSSDLQTQLNGKAASSHTHTTGGDVGGSLTALTVTGVQGRAISTTAPTNGQSLVWNSGTAQWQPQYQSGGVATVFGRNGSVTAQAGDYSFGQISGSITDAQVGTGINATKIGGGTVGNTAFGYLANVTGDVQAQLNGKAATNQALAGDVGGNLSAATVIGLRSRSVSPTAPSNGQALVWNSGTAQWEPQNQIGGISSVFGRNGTVTAQAGDYSFSQISGTVTDSQLSTGINANKIGPGSVSNTTFGYLASVTSDVQAQLNGKAAASHTHTASGDVTGSLGATTVTALQNRAVSPVAPTNGQALAWNSALAQWQPQDHNGGVASVFGRNGVVTAQTGDYSFSQIAGTVTDSQVSPGVNATKVGTGSVSNTAFGYLANVTSDLQGQLNGKSATGHTHSIGGDVTGSSLSSTTVTALQSRSVSSAAPSNGQALVWNSAANQWQPQSQSGGTGSQQMGGDVTGMTANATVGAIQNRTVSTTPPTNGQVLMWNAGTTRWEPQNLPNSTNGSYSSSFVSQTTVTIPGALHQLGTANLLVGCYDNSTPNVRVQTNNVSVNTTTYDVTVTFSTPQSGRCVLNAGGAGSGGAGGGASMASQLGDFGVTWTSNSALTIGPNCSASTPCNVRVGNSVYRYVSGTTITVTAGTGTAYVYVDANGVLTVGHKLTLSCASPCAAVSNISTFPVNSIPLYTWTATGGAWDVTGGVDQRAVLSGKVLTAGAGIVTLDTGSSTNISVDTAVVPRYLTATALLGFGPITTGACAADQTISVPGASVGDAVAPGWPIGIGAGLIGNMWVSAPNTVAVRICNLSGGTVTPAAATYRGTVVRNF